jgi:hypothetical protein
VVHELQPRLEVRELEHPLDLFRSPYKNQAPAGLIPPDGGSEDQAQAARIQERDLAQIDQDDGGIFRLDTSDPGFDLIRRCDVDVTLEKNLNQVRAHRFVNNGAGQPSTRPVDQAFLSPPGGRHGASLAIVRKFEDSLSGSRALAPT